MAFFQCEVGTLYDLKEETCVPNDMVDCKVFSKSCSLALIGKDQTHGTPAFQMYDSIPKKKCKWMYFLSKATHRPCASETHCSCVDRLPAPQEVNFLTFWRIMSQALHVIHGGDDAGREMRYADASTTSALCLRWRLAAQEDKIIDWIFQCGTEQGKGLLWNED